MPIKPVSCQAGGREKKVFPVKLNRGEKIVASPLKFIQKKEKPLLQPHATFAKKDFSLPDDYLIEAKISNAGGITFPL
ncbi:hypothetical protein KBI33_02885 [Candidatus Shapirobacteria bacterium]|nr:hypothetical protein [Candidatus Shapirobacteria bacterium]